MNSQTVLTIKATHALLETNALAITEKMYELLFAGHPELKPLFQSENQDLKLARAIIAYSQNIDQVEEMYPALYKISKKHVDANIQPDHYLMVAEALLNAMNIILGKEQFTEEMKTAWTDAYYTLAAILIRTEQDIYDHVKLAKISG